MSAVTFTCKWGRCQFTTCSGKEMREHIREKHIAAYKPSYCRCLWKGCSKGDYEYKTFDGFANHISDCHVHVFPSTDSPAESNPGLFTGSSQPSNNSFSFSFLGDSSSQPKSTGVFDQPQPSFSFGSNSANPAQPKSTGIFDQPQPSFSFGSNPANPAQPASSGLFGQSQPSGLFGQPQPSGLFGQPSSSFGSVPLNWSPIK